MPAIIPAVVGLAAAAGAAAAGLGTAFTIGTFAVSWASIIGTVVSLGASLLMGALTKPKSSALAPSTTGLAEDRKQMIRGAIEPRQVIYGRARVSGAIVYAASSGPDQRYLHLVVVLAGHSCHEIPVVWLNDTAIQPVDCDGSGMVTSATHPMQGRVRVQKFLGNQTQAPPDLVAESPDGWAAADRLAGCTFLYLRLEYDPEKLPGLNSVSAEVRGKNDVWDPRSNAGGWTDNWALCVLDYLRSPFGLACAEEEIDLASFAAAANLSDEAVAIEAGLSLTQPRYRCDGAFKLDRTPLDVMDDLLTAGGGALVYVAGRYRLHGGAYATPSGTIGPADFAGEVEVIPRAARADLFNGVRGTFIDPARNWEPSEFTAVFDAAFDAQDGGERVWTDIELPFTIDALRAHRLALMSLRRARQALRIKAPMKFSALRFCVWQTVTVTLPELGLEARPMRVIGWEYEPDSGRVTVELQAEAISAYAYLYDAAYALAPPPDTTLVDPLALPQPDPPQLTPTTTLADDGTIQPAILVSWAPIPHAFVLWTELQWRLNGGPWQSVMVAAPAASFTIAPVVVGGSYEARIRAASHLARGRWSNLANALGLADATVPPAPTGVAATGMIRAIRVTWNTVPIRDLARYRVYERATTAAPWVLAAELLSTNFIRAGLLPGESREYRITAVDRSGNEGSPSAIAGATTSLLIAADIADGILNTAKFASSIKVTEVIASLAENRPEGTYAVNQGDNQLYRVLAGSWVKAVRAPDLQGQLSGAQLQDLAVGPAKLAAGAVTTSKLAVGSANTIWNGCCTISATGWQALPGSMSGTPVLGAASAPWRLIGLGSGLLTLPGTQAPGTEAFVQWLPQVDNYGVAAEAGQRWQAAVEVQVHRAQARLWLMFFGPGGELLRAGSATQAANAAADAATLDRYARLTVLADAPAGTTAALLRLVMTGTGEANPYVFFTRALLGEAPPSASEVGEWQAGGVTLLHGGMLQTDTVDSRAINTGELFANSGVFNDLRAGIATLGGLRATEIMANEIRGYHMASETIISQAGQLGTLVVGTAQIQDAAIKNAKIGSAEIDELKIAGDAITTWRSGAWSGAWGVPNLNTIIDETFNSPSSRPAIIAMESHATGTIYFDPTNSATYGAGVLFRFLVNSALVHEWASGPSFGYQALSTTRSVWLAAGSNRVQVTIQPHPYDNTVGTGDFSQSGYGSARFGAFAILGRAR